MYVNKLSIVTFAKKKITKLRRSCEPFVYAKKEEITTFVSTICYLLLKTFCLKVKRVILEAAFFVRLQAMPLPRINLWILVHSYT